MWQHPAGLPRTRAEPQPPPPPAEAAAHWLGSVSMVPIEEQQVKKRGRRGMEKYYGGFGRFQFNMQSFTSPHLNICAVMHHKDTARPRPHTHHIMEMFWQFYTSSHLNMSLINTAAVLLINELIIKNTFLEL